MDTYLQYYNKFVFEIVIWEKPVIDLSEFILLHPTVCNVLHLSHSTACARTCFVPQDRPINTSQVPTGFILRVISDLKWDSVCQEYHNYICQCGLSRVWKGCTNTLTIFFSQQEMAISDRMKTPVRLTPSLQCTMTGGQGAGGPSVPLILLRIDCTSLMNPVMIAKRDYVTWQQRKQW